MGDRAPANVLADEGRLHLVFQTEWDERVRDGARAAGLHITRACHFRMRSDSTRPFLTTYELRREPATLESETLAVRRSSGEYTPEFRELRRELGMSDAPTR